jgi:hypothetical protein
MYTTKTGARKFDALALDEYTHLPLIARKYEGNQEGEHFYT